MNPIEQLLMAARGHQGLPMQIGGPPDQGGDPTAQGGPPAPMGPEPGLPPSAPPPLSGEGSAPAQGGSDREVAETAAQHLLAATHQATDPALKAAFSQALAALHKYIVMDEKEHHQAMAGKFSPRMMAQPRA